MSPAAESAMIGPPGWTVGGGGRAGGSFLRGGLEGSVVSENNCKMVRWIQSKDRDAGTELDF